MAKKLDPAKELTTREDIAYSNMAQDEAVLQFSEYQSQCSSRKTFGKRYFVCGHPQIEISPE